MNNLNNLLLGVQWHGFAFMDMLQASVEHKRAHRQWLDGNDGIAMLLNPEPFLQAGYQDREFNQDMGFKLIPLAAFHEMRADAGGNDYWDNYQSPSHRHGQNPLRRDIRYGVIKAQGNHVQDRETVWLEHFEVKGDLRCRRRLFFPPAVAAAIGAEPLVLLQYKRFPFCHPAAHRLALLLAVEEIEAAEAAANQAGGALAGEDAAANQHAGGVDAAAGAAGGLDAAAGAAGGVDAAAGAAGGVDAAAEAAAAAGGVDAAAEAAAAAGGVGAAEAAGDAALEGGAAAAGGEY